MNDRLLCILTDDEIDFIKDEFGVDFRNDNIYESSLALLYDEIADIESL